MILIAVVGALLVVFVLWDVFEVIVLPRRVQRRFRPARYFFRSTWRLWRAVAGRTSGAARESFLSFFGPLFLLMLIAAWATALIFAYGQIYWGIDAHVAGSPGDETNFGTYLSYSGTTFFTLGLGDLAPDGRIARVVTVLEVANGFGFLALVIGYLPVFYQSFSRRETAISLLDARAGSPPTAGELIRRFSEAGNTEAVASLLADWERWSAELLESHLSYPVLMSFRSQHERQSWVAALTMILDTSAIFLARGPSPDAHAARLTFAMARHAAADLSDTFGPSPASMPYDRLPPEDFRRLEDIVRGLGPLPATFEDQLTYLRTKYEPFVWTLADFLLLELPPWIPAPDALDAWQTNLPPRPDRVQAHAH
jgi:hypothetical protein